jgi:hypothetical protein
MLAAPAAAVVAAAVVEPPVLAVADLAHLPVLGLAQAVAHLVQLPLPARLLSAKAHLPVLVPPVLAGLPVLAHLVVEPAVAVELLLSPQSCSAAMARSTP